MTQTGFSLGTPHYMSPEQAMGEKNVGGRSDVYAVGAVLYEMLTGEPPFTGASVQAIVAKVMTERPMSPRTVRDTVPAYVEMAVLRALAKLPADRYGTAKEFAGALDARGSTAASAEALTRTPAAARRRALPWLVAGAIGLLLGGASVALWRDTHAAPVESVRFTIEAPAGMSLYDGFIERQFALSADGRSLLLTAGSHSALFLRRLNELRSTPVAGIDHATDFQLSPDGEFVVYSTGTTSIIRKVRASGGEASIPVTLLADSAPSRFSWTRGTDILYTNAAGLWRLPSSGGLPRRIVARDTSDFGWGGASLLEDGRTIAFRTHPRGRASGLPGHLRIVSIDGGPVSKVDLEIENVVGYRGGYLIYGTRDGALAGVRFDLASRTVRGEPVTLTEGISSRMFLGLSASLGANGTLAYMSGVSTSRVDVVDEHGAAVSTLPLEPRKLTTVNWSPDGTRVLLQSGPAGQSDLWMYDTTTRISTRLTQTGKVQQPVWTRDSKRVAFIGSGTPNNTLMWMPADGSAPAEPIPAAEAAGVHGGFSFSFDGRYLLAFAAPQWDRRFTTPFIAIPLAGGNSTPLLAGVTRPTAPRTSPDGRWMAYSSEEGERREVYIRPFPSGPGRLQLSTNGGTSPIWTRDGRHVVYRGESSVRRVTLDVSGALPRLVRDDSLFASADWKDFSVHPDGTRFALIRDAGEGAKLVVVTHWLDEALAKLRR